MNGWLHNSKKVMLQDAVRRCLEGRESGEYIGKFLAVKDEEGSVTIRNISLVNAEVTNG